MKLSIIYQNSRSKVNVEDDVGLCRSFDVLSEHVHWHTHIKLVGRGLSFYHAKLADVESENSWNRITNLCKPVVRRENHVGLFQQAEILESKIDLLDSFVQ